MKFDKMKLAKLMNCFFPEGKFRYPFLGGEENSPEKKVSLLESIKRKTQSHANSPEIRVSLLESLKRKVSVYWKYFF